MRKGLRRLAAAVIGGALMLAAAAPPGLGEGQPATGADVQRSPGPFATLPGLSWLETGPEAPGTEPSAAPSVTAYPSSTAGLPGMSLYYREPRGTSSAPAPRAASHSALQRGSALPPVVELGTRSDGATAPEGHTAPALPWRALPPAPALQPAAPIETADRAPAAPAQYPSTTPEPAPMGMFGAPLEEAVGTAAKEQPRAPEAAVPVGARPRIHPAVVHHAESLVQQGYGEAQRGMFYAARASFIESLSAVAQALDAEEGTQRHARALAAGLRALEEAEDFAKAPAATVPVETSQVVVGHQTPVLKSAAGVSPLQAQQAYYVFAQEQLAACATGVPIGSAALTGLGRLSGLMASEPKPLTHNGNAAGVVCLQAALIVDANNAVAANELGVFLARQGRLAEARGWLAHSVAIQPRRESCSNLAVVCRELGEGALAARAIQESTELARRETAAGAAARVRWVDPKVFAGMSGGEAPTREPQKPAAESADGRASGRSSGWMPWRK